MHQHQSMDLVSRHKKFWGKEHIASLIQGLALFAAALVIQSIADAYVVAVPKVTVGDIILSNIPTFDIDFLIIQGALILTVACIILLAIKPRYFLFTLKALSLFIIIRSFFVSLTHLGVDPHELKFDTSSVGFGLYNFLYNTKGDFFFSGHTGLPFLMSLVFWRERAWRIFFLVTSVTFGISVLLAHVHYSIDVFAAPFMAWGIFCMSREFFKKDYELIKPSVLES